MKIAGAPAFPPHHEYKVKPGQSLAGATKNITPVFEWDSKSEILTAWTTVTES